MNTSTSDTATAANSRSKTPVRNVMHVGVLDCPPQTPMFEIAQLMAKADVHCVVVDGLARGPGRTERLVWGIVSDLDLAKALAAGRLADPAGEFAVIEPITISPDEDLQAAAQLMAEHECSHLLVTDEATGRPIGVLSTLDIARGLLPAT